MLTCLGVLHVPALHVGSQEDIAHEGFVTEVALGRGRESAGGLPEAEKGSPHIPGMAKVCCHKAKGETSRDVAVVSDVRRY